MSTNICARPIPSINGGLPCARVRGATLAHQELHSRLVSSQPLYTEHAGLLAHARALLDDLAFLKGSVVSGEVSYEQHRTYGKRAAACAEQLEAALILTETNRYGAAFCLLRPALEQLVFDRLLCLGNRYVQRIKGVSETTFEQWKADRKAGADWAKNVLRMERYSDNTVRIEFRGVTLSDAANSEQTLSIYFFLLHEYQPFVPPAKELPFLLPDFGDKEQQQEHSRTQHEIYHTSLRWPQLLSNLRLNELATDADTRRISVHYRFLSAFVHPLNDHYRALYGNNYDLGRPLRYDHYSSELCLLYTVAFAIFELDSLLSARARVPAFDFADAGTMEAHLAQARKDVSYLWFVGDDPHLFDRIQESNRRYWSLPSLAPSQIVDPRTLSAREIRYYQNPLHRIIQMHSASQELMGHSFPSPWPRPDAAHRPV